MQLLRRAARGAASNFLLLLCGPASLVAAADWTAPSDTPGIATLSTVSVGEPGRCATCPAAVPLPEHPGPHQCVIVPDIRHVKKTVYATKRVPFCVHEPFCLHDSHCAQCEARPRWKRVLVKCQIVVEEICGYKCVAQPCPHGCVDELVPPAPRP